MGDTVTDSKKCGVFYGVGVGPGDPELLTRKAERILRAAWDEGAALICGELEQGRSVAFVTLGDPGIYSTCGYLLRRVRQRGFETQLVPGVPSFCAAAAALGVSLCQGREPLTIVPAASPEL